jgi:hypothetical protein
LTDEQIKRIGKLSALLHLQDAEPLAMVPGMIFEAIDRQTVA